jgi:hypothetical protein
MATTKRTPRRPSVSANDGDSTASPKRAARKTVKTSGGFKVQDSNINRSKALKWLWQDRILQGYLNLMVGVEGVGKSTFVCWIAARTTRGELPGTLEGKPSRIVVIGDEDSWNDIWTPRLYAAGADLKLCQTIVSTADDDGINITDVEQMSNLEAYITEHGVKLVFFDALLDNIGYTDSWKQEQVRRAFAPLRSVVTKTQSSCLFSVHPNKRTGSFRDRINGSPAFNALPRSGLLVAKHPTDPDRVVAVQAKRNYNAEPAAFEFRIAAEQVRGDIVASVVADVAETDLRAADVLDGEGRREETSQAAKCRRRVEELLADGAEHDAAEMTLKLGAEGYTPTTIQRATSALKVRKSKSGFKNGWTWQLKP